MRPSPWLLALAPLLAAPTGAADRVIEESFPVGAATAVAIDFPVGGLEVEAGGNDRVTVELRLRCRRERNCEEAVRDVELRAHPGADRLRLEVTGLSRWRGRHLEIEGRVMMPRALALEVDMGVGELEVSGVESDLTLKLGVGEMTVSLSEETVRSVWLDAGIGDASLYGPGRSVEGRRALLLGSEVEWDDGPGAARVRAEVGVGEVTVRLDD